MIQGIRSSDTPEGRINSRLRHLPTWNPYSDLGLIVYKATFPIFPEPEIYLPAGTDLRLKLEKPHRRARTVAPARGRLRRLRRRRFRVAGVLARHPDRTTTTTQGQTPTSINLALRRLA